MVENEQEAMNVRDVVLSAVKISYDNYWIEMPVKTDIIKESN